MSAPSESSSAVEPASQSVAFVQTDVTVDGEAQILPAPTGDEPVTGPDIRFWTSDRFKDLELMPIMEVDIVAMIKNAHDLCKLPYQENSDLVDDIAERLIEEIESLARLTNPDSTFRPEWYDEDEDTMTPSQQLIDRDDFDPDYRDHLVAAYDINPNVAAFLIESLGNFIEGHSPQLNEFYSAPAVAEEK